MEDEARTWALPYLELLAQGLLAFQGDYSHFVQAFLKRFAPRDTTEAARDALKALKQGKNSVACHGRYILLPLIFYFERHVTVGDFTCCE